MCRPAQRVECLFALLIKPVQKTSRILWKNKIMCNRRGKARSKGGHSFFNSGDRYAPCKGLRCHILHGIKRKLCWPFQTSKPQPVVQHAYESPSIISLLCCANHISVPPQSSRIQPCAPKWVPKNKVVDKGDGYHGAPTTLAERANHAR